MKKYIFIALLGLLTFSIQAKDSLNVAVIPDSSQLHFREVYTDIKAGISALAEGLKVGSEHVYKVLITQQIVKSVSFTIFFVLGVILLIVCCRKFPKLGWRTEFYYPSEWKEKGGYEAFKKENMSFVNILYIVLTILSIVSITIPLAHMDVTVTGYLNPEYGAIKEIMDIVKGK